MKRVCHIQVTVTYRDVAFLSTYTVTLIIAPVTHLPRQRSRTSIRPWSLQNFTMSSNNSFLVRSTAARPVRLLIYLIGAFKTLADLPLPEAESEDYIPILFYKARALIALGDSTAVSSLIPTDSENLALKSVAALAKYTSGADASDAALEELRDLAVEIEGDDADATDREKGWVRVVAGTAFARASEVEEALETLGVASSTENLEAYVSASSSYPSHGSIVVYLCSNRPLSSFYLVSHTESQSLFRYIYPSTGLILLGRSSNARSSGLKTISCCSLSRLLSVSRPVKMATRIAIPSTPNSWRTLRSPRHTSSQRVALHVSCAVRSRKRSLISRRPCRNREAMRMRRHWLQVWSLQGLVVGKRPMLSNCGGKQTLFVCPILSLHRYADHL